MNTIRPAMHGQPTKNIELGNEQSKMLQGAAILMMLYHHLFSTPEALGTPFTSLLIFGDLNIERKVAYFFKLCVGLYAFVTGYGMCKLLNRNGKQKTFLSNLRHDYLVVFKKLGRFYLKFFLVFIVFVPVGFLFFDKPFDGKDFLLSLLGLSSVYNGAWWYVALYYRMLLVAPLLNGLFYGSVLYDACCAGLLFVLYLIPTPSGRLLAQIMAGFHPAFFSCFIVGFLLARFQIVEALGKLPKWILYTLGILAMLYVIYRRVQLAVDASSAGLDFWFVPLFVFGFLCITKIVPPIGKVCAFFGAYSTYMWLTHVFFYDHYANKIVMASRVSAGIYLTLVALSFVAAYCLTLLEKKILQTAAKKKASGEIE